MSIYSTLSVLYIVPQKCSCGKGESQIPDIGKELGSVVCCKDRIMYMEPQF